MNFTGKTALITGGASGIGKATVMEFARCGARVICADVDAAKGVDLVREAGNLAVEFVAIDLADPVSVHRCAAEVLDRYGRVDILVNAAGWNDIQPFLDNPPDYMDRVLAVNLGGLLHLTQALLPAMVAASKGKIVNVSSDAGRVGSSGETAYAAAKGGVIAFTKSLARESRALFHQRQLRLSGSDRYAHAAVAAGETQGSLHPRYTVPALCQAAGNRRRDFVFRQLALRLHYRAGVEHQRRVDFRRLKPRLFSTGDI